MTSYALVQKDLHLTAIFLTSLVLILSALVTHQQISNSEYRDAPFVENAFFNLTTPTLTLIILLAALSPPLYFRKTVTIVLAVFLPIGWVLTIGLWGNCDFGGSGWRNSGQLDACLVRGEGVGAPVATGRFVVAVLELVVLLGMVIVRGYNDRNRERGEHVKLSGGEEADIE